MPGDFDLVKERVDIVQVINERVALKRAGRIYRALCPFHAEKTPSFTVDPERRSYHCFGCGEQGDVFTWLEKQDGLSRGEALRVLAEKAGVELTSRRDPAERDREKRLVAVNETAHFYFRQALRGTEAGREVARYIGGRGIEPAAVERFGLGYAPELRDGLAQYLRKKGFTDEEGIAAGVLGANERGPYDHFRGRLIVPIKDGRGRIVGFGGRAMRPDQPGKYVNTRQTTLFNKSATLFALDLARVAIRKAGAAVIVEGYFDAIAMHQAGFANTVASMGTALTEEQYLALEGMRVDRAIVAFDGDAAGQLSAERRGSEVVRVVHRAKQRAGRGEVGKGAVSVEVTVLPEGADPDELARRDPDRLRDLLAVAKPVLEFVIERIAGRSNLDRPEGRRRFLAEALPLVAGEPDALTRELYLGTLSRLTGLRQEALRSEAAAAPASLRGATATNETPAKQTGSRERYLMALLSRFPEEAAHADLDPSDLEDPDLRELYVELRAGKHPNSDLPAHLAAVVAALGATTPELGEEVDVAQAIDIAALGIREQNLRRKLKEAQEKLTRSDQGDVGALNGAVAQLAFELAELMKRKERQTVLHAADMDERDE